MKKILFAAFLWSAALSSTAQLTGTTPLRYAQQVRSQSPFLLQVNPNELTQARNEDELNDKLLDRPYRIGLKKSVDLPWSSFQRQDINGMTVLSKEIASEGAQGLTFYFDQFHLPESARLYVINKETGSVFGPVEANNNSATNDLLMWPNEGAHQQIVIEINTSELVDLQLHLGEITHVYRGLKSSQGPGDSGPCNVNAICPEAQNWINQRNSTVIILAGGSGFCSGTLINNTLNDGKPYILTAQHCGLNVNNWSFRFNYQSTSCASNSIAPGNQTVSGATLKATNGDSDVSLLLMNSKPPTSYNAYYSGWDRSDAVPSSQFCFHHPSADLKKFSRNTNPAVKDFYLSGNTPPITWRVDAWELGTTEGGSSGSALWDQNGRIIGQLVGGGASCSAPQESDYYGRMFTSFRENSDSSKTLRYWLDPSSSGVLTLDGLDGAATPPTNDIAISSILGVSPEICGNQLSPVFSVKNVGSNAVTSFNYSVSIDGSTVFSGTFSGNLASQATTSFAVGNQTVSAGSHQITFNVSSPNGQADANAINNGGTLSFTANPSGKINTLRIVLDDYGSENTWVVKNGQGTTLVGGGPYPDQSQGVVINTNVCLTPGCYTFEMYDSFGDGMCCSFGQGSYQFTDWIGNVLASGWKTPGAGEVESTPICIQGSGISELISKPLTLYPNPNNGRFALSNDLGEISEISIFDVSGKLVQRFRVGKEQTISVELNQSGWYTIEARGEQFIYRGKVQVLKN
ncbi:MAG TPA: T9SS type A sorting domain-containing protein [Luteibaculaceae bacterium]|nr:T9SS type A sorting domain-containing protein [Luteibaculaceae bacterium]